MKGFIRTLHELTVITLYSTSAYLSALLAQRHETFSTLIEALYLESNISFIKDWLTHGQKMMKILLAHLKNLHVYSRVRN